MKIVVPNVAPVGVSDPHIYDGAIQREKEDVSGNEEFDESEEEADAETTNRFGYETIEVERRSLNNNARMAHLIAGGMTHAEAIKSVRADPLRSRGVDYPMSTDCKH